MNLGRDVSFFLDASFFKNNFTSATVRINSKDVNFPTIATDTHANYFTWKCHYR